MQKKDNEQMPNAKREEWNVKDISEQSVNEMPDEILRKTLRGNEQDGGGSERDVAGNVDSGETPQGREETKNGLHTKANTNG